jgi:hypothetical protein
MVRTLPVNIMCKRWRTPCGQRERRTYIPQKKITKVADESATAGARKAECVAPEDPLDGYQGHDGEGLKDHGK